MLNKKVYKTLFFSIICVFLLVGCEQTSKIPLEDAVTAQYNLYMKGEKSDKLPLTEEEINEVLAYYKKSMEKEIKYTLSNFNVKEIPDDRLNSLYKKTFELSKNIDPKIKIISEEKDVASVKITAKVIDETKYAKKFEEECSKFSEEELNDPNIILNIYEIYLDEIIKNPIYKDANINIALAKTDNEWLMNDESDLDKLNTFIPR